MTMTDKKTTAFEVKSKSVEDGFIESKQYNGSSEIADDFLRTFFHRGFRRWTLLDGPANPFAGAERRVNAYVDRLNLKKYSVDVIIDGKFYSMDQIDKGKTDICRWEPNKDDSGSPYTILPLDMSEKDFFARLREIVRRHLFLVARNCADLETDEVAAICNDLFAFEPEED